MYKQFLAIALIITLSNFTHAELWVPRIFSNGMIIQRGKPLTVWGRDLPKTKITVSIAGAKGQSVTGDDGRWRVKIPALKFSGSETLRIQGSESKMVKDVLLGEVWLASGQSNMEFQLHKMNDDEVDLAATKDLPIRFFKVGRHAAATPVEDVTGEWSAPNKNYSAVAYFFARTLHKERGVPIGIIQSGWSGSAIEAWIPYERLETMPAADYKISKYQDFLKTNTAPVDTAEVITSKAAAKRPAHLYNGMIHPIAGYSATGVIWYQGESNVGKPYAYSLFGLEMLRAWRQIWDDPTLGFFPVQLANYRKKQSHPSEGGLGPFREAQLSVLSMPYTGAATAVDVGDADNVHPKNKQPVGHRLAISALHVMYGRTDLPKGSPTLDKVLIQNNKVILTIKDINGGLRYQPDSKYSGFALQDESGKWQWADVTLKGAQLILQSDAVPNPKYVRYGWANNPCLSIFSKDGFPLLPFRTDTKPYRDSNRYKRK